MTRTPTLGTAALLMASATAQQPLTLRQAIDHGRAHSPSLALPANGERRAAAQFHEALAGYLPQINGTGQFDDNLKRQTTILPAGAFGPEPVAVQFGTQFNTNLSVQAEQMLVDVAQINGLQANVTNRKMAALKKQQAEEQLVYDVCRAYLQAQVYGEQVKLLEENLKQYDELVPILTLRLEKGVAQPLDVDRVEVTQRNIASQLTVARANAEVATAQLKRTIGMPMNEDISLADPVPASADMRQPSAVPFALTNLSGAKYLEQALMAQTVDLRRVYAFGASRK